MRWFVGACILVATSAHAETAAEKTLRDVRQASDAARMVSADKTILEKRCVLSAAERLPKIPGIVVKDSRVTGPPPNIKLDPAIFTTTVEFGVSAVGQDAVYRYLCSTTLAGQTVIVLDTLR